MLFEVSFLFYQYTDNIVAADDDKAKNKNINIELTHG